MGAMKFVSFHSHDTYSYGDALGSTERHVKTVADLGMTALGTSNHGNVNNHVQMEIWCKEYGVKPIYGCEIYFAPAKREAKYQRKTHLTIFAMNEEGYANLNRIITQSYLDFYQWPTVSQETLKKYSKGICVLSGCADSLISCTLMGGKFLGDKRDKITEPDFKRAVRRLQWFATVFEGRFYIEVQRFPHFDRTCTLNPAYEQLSRITGIPLIATADVHYPTKRENKMQALLHAARWSSDPDFASEASWEHHANLSYPTSDQEIYDDLKRTGLTAQASKAAILETTKLAGKCNVTLPKANRLEFPGVSSQRAILCSDKTKPITQRDLDQVNHMAATLLMKQKIKEGWKKRCEQRPDLKDKQAEYQKRLDHEFKIISDKDFENYFLCVGDLVSWAKQQDITVGPGRGSAAGSLVCYVLGITEIDPMHPLFSRMIFERFIDPNRSDMPDIDLDFDDELRHLIPERAVEIYGQENVCSVANHTKYRGKRAIQDVARAYKLPYSTFKPITKRIATRVETDDRVDDSLLDILDAYNNDPEISALVDSYHDKLEQAIELEGNQHSMGIHAGGFVISSDPIPNVCAIYTKEKGSGRSKELVQVIPYEKRDAEYLGMLKMDFLGLITMGMIGLMRKWTGMSLDELYSLIYNAKEWHHETVLEHFQVDDVVGIFQYEGGTTRQVVREVQPANFDELAACNALSRPGPYYGGQTRQYIAVKNGSQELEKIHPEYDKHVEWTYGQIVYQEQIMWILRDLAGFDVPTVLQVRKIIGKKLGEFQFAALWQQFCDGCVSKGVSEEQAQQVWGAITTAAGYAFNTAHAYSYALIAWWQMYFKVYHKTNIFYAANLAKNGDGKDDISRRTALLADAERKGLKLLPVLLEASHEQWFPHGDDHLLPGLRQLPKIGPAGAEDLIAWRANLPFQDYDNLTWDGAARPAAKGGCNGIGATTVEAIKSFLGSSDPFGIHATEKQLEAFREQLDNGDFDGTGLPSPEEYVSAGSLSEAPDSTDNAAFVGLIANIIERDEIESKRQRTGQTREEIVAAMDAPEKSKKATIFAYDETGECALRVSRFQYQKLASRISRIKTDHHIVVAWGRVFEGKANSIQVKELWILDPD